MRVRLDDWETIDDKSSFIVEMACLPAKGEEITIHETLFPEHYFTGIFESNPMDVVDGWVTVTVFAIRHIIDSDGNHLPEICIEIGLEPES